MAVVVAEIFEHGSLSKKNVDSLQKLANVTPDRLHLTDFMDYRLLSRKVARMRAELQQIGNENRLYFSTQTHHEAEIERHQARQERVLEIKAELETLMKRKTA